MFGNLLENLKERTQQHFDKKKAEKEEMEMLQREVDFKKKQIFQDEFRKNALEVARAQAKKEAAKASGLQKLRATNRLRRLNETNAENPGNYLSKFAEYTQKNLAKREENMKRTEAMRSEGKKIKEESMNKGSINPQIRKPFQPSGFGKRN